MSKQAKPFLFRDTPEIDVSTIDFSSLGPEVDSVRKNEPMIMPPRLQGPSPSDFSKMEMLAPPVIQQPDLVWRLDPVDGMSRLYWGEEHVANVLPIPHQGFSLMVFGNDDPSFFPTLEEAKKIGESEVTSRILKKLSEIQPVVEAGKAVDREPSEANYKALVKAIRKWEKIW
jgi:hypothetical protein